MRRSLPTSELPHVIQPTAVYTRRQLMRSLHLQPKTLREEIAAGRLRVAVRAGKYWFLGAWLLEWLADGERGGKERTSHAPQD